MTYSNLQLYFPSTKVGFVSKVWSMSRGRHFECYCHKPWHAIYILWFCDVIQITQGSEQVHKRYWSSSIFWPNNIIGKRFLIQGITYSSVLYTVDTSGDVIIKVGSSKQNGQVSQINPITWDAAVQFYNTTPNIYTSIRDIIVELGIDPSEHNRFRGQRWLQTFQTDV